jgi:hypothetical protein
MTRYRWRAAAILAVGLGLSLAVYIHARETAGDAEFQLEETKKYLRDLAQYGGTANVIATDVRHWFTSLWQGVNLAKTLAVLSAAVAGAYLYIAPRAPKKAPR